MSTKRIVSQFYIYHTFITQKTENVLHIIMENCVCHEQCITKDFTEESLHVSEYNHRNKLNNFSYLQCYLTQNLISKQKTISTSAKMFYFFLTTYSCAKKNNNKETRVSRFKF